MYKLVKETLFDGSIVDSNVIIREDNAYIPFDPANTDYARFKAEINADEAELQDADGNEMTPEEAKAYVSTLP